MIMKLKKKSSVNSSWGKTTLFSDFRENYELYLMILIPLIYVIVFKYFPMYGAQIAFKDYRVTSGINGSEWVGLKHFERLFSAPQFWTVLKNTFVIAFYFQLVSIPLPIIFAIGINYCRSSKLKKTVQMITYLPHFLSVVIIVSLMNLLFNSYSGVMTNIIEAIFKIRPNILGDAKYFRHMFVWSGIWQGLGWSSILYVSALAGVDPSLHEAAMIDGANKLKRIWHIDIPHLVPTISIMIITSVGSLLTVSFDKTFLMQNPVNFNVSEVLSTYEYKRGLAASIPDYSFPSAIGLASSAFTFVLTLLTNRISNKLSGSGLW